MKWTLGKRIEIGVNVVCKSAATSFVGQLSIVLKLSSTITKSGNDHEPCHEDSSAAKYQQKLNKNE